MSDNPQFPKNPTDPNSDTFSKDFAGLAENDLWDLDKGSNEDFPQLEAISEQKPSTPREFALMSDYEATEETDSSSPADQTTAIHTKLSFSEKAGLSVFIALLAAIAGLSLIYFSKEIPIDSTISKKVSLPVKGKILNISDVETYWRKPITQGENPDIVRSGIQLIPVVEIHTEGSAGAIRIFFRDEEGTLVGDSITIAIAGSETHHISATDGFADQSMHAAYRTGNTARWLVQAFEGPSIDAPIEQFTPLFETEISTDIR